jgi:4-amino-4-deoxy-L-arabinose transferase-like glycosyltransferase
VNGVLRTERPYWVLLLLVMGVFGWISLANLSVVAGGSDSSGYLNDSRLLERAEAVRRTAALDRFDLDDAYNAWFIPLGFKPGKRPGTNVPYYPAGLPLEMAAVKAMAGREWGGALVVPISGTLGLLVFYILARQLELTAMQALAAVCVLAAFPTYLYESLQPMSDAVATAWSMTAVAFALLSRRRAQWALVAGAALGMGVLVRPTTALLFPVVLIAMPLRRRSYALLVLGGLPFAAFNAFYNHFTYGAVSASGYAGAMHSDMAWSFFPRRLQHYAWWLAALLTPLIPLGWLALPLDHNVPARHRLMLMLWFGIFFLFYCFYRHYDTWWYTRFLLPAVPAMILAATFAMRDGLTWLAARSQRLEHRPHFASAVGAALCLVVVANGIYWSHRHHVLGTAEGESVYREAVVALQRRAPAKSVVVAMQVSGAVTYYSDFSVLRWDALDAEKFAFVRRRIESKGYELYALLFPFEEEGFRQKVPGSWRKIGDVRQVSLWRLGTGAPSVGEVVPRRRSTTDRRSPNGIGALFSREAG